MSAAEAAAAQRAGGAIVAERDGERIAGAALGSLMVTPANGAPALPTSWSVPATVPPMVGATAGSVLITVVVLLTVGVASALLRSLSVKVVVVLEPGAPAVGVNTSASVRC